MPRQDTNEKELEATDRPDLGATNPFRAGGETGSDIFLSPPKSAQTAKQPPATPSLDPMVRYRDPITGQLTTKRRSALRTGVGGDDLNGTRCSTDGLEVVTEACEARRRAETKDKDKAVP